MNGTTRSELAEYCLSRFNIAAALMTVIPLLICCYLIAAKFFSVWILVGLNGLYFGMAVFVAVGGLLFGRNVITNIVKQLIVLEGRATSLAHQAESAAASEKARAVELDEAYQNLQKMQAMLVHAEKMGAVGELASGVAHEVKNPLAIIMQGVNFLEQDQASKPEQTEVLGMVKEAVIRADKIVRGLLDFSRPGELKLAPCELNPVLDQAVDLVDKQLTLQNIQTTRDYARDLPAILADSDQVKQVLINLILNAAQAMPEGGTLTLRTYAKTLGESDPGVGRRATDLFRPGQAVVCCDVADTGRGIPPDKLEKVFDPFYTTRPPAEGTGLGLSITKSIIQAHRGLILIQSEVGRGTTVHMVFRLSDGRRPSRG